MSDRAYASWPPSGIPIDQAAGTLPVERLAADDGADFDAPLPPSAEPGVIAVIRDSGVNDAHLPHWYGVSDLLAGASLDAASLQGRGVAPSAPADGQALVWNEAAGAWEPGTVSGGGGTPVGVAFLSLDGTPITIDGALITVTA